MTAPVGLIEIEEAEAPVVAAEVLVPRPVRRCACGSVKLADQVRHGDEVCRPFTIAPAREADPYPKPEITSRDHWDGVDAPSPVAKLAEKARKAGWRVKAQRSRGCPPNSGTGAPMAVRTLYAVLFRNGYASAYAVHDGDKWSSIMLWSQERSWFAGASVTDLGQYLTVGGRVDDVWINGIRHREADKAARTKARAACNKGTHAGAVLSSGRWECATCGNSWGAREAAWRKPKVSKAEAL